MDYGNLSVSATERFKRNVSSRVRKPACDVFIAGIGDVSAYVKNYDFDRQISNSLRENQPSTGSVVITDVNGEWIENGHPIIKAGAGVIINAGFDNDMIPRYTGIVNNSRADTKSGEITLEISDNASILSEKQAEGFFSDYPFPKDLINKIISGINPNISVNYDSSAGEVATFDFGSSLGASFASLCSAGSGTTMIDTTHNFEKVELGMAIKNVTDGSVGLITTITSTAPATTPNDTIVCSAGLHGGSDNSWAVNDAYQVYEKLYIEPRSFWDLIVGATYCVFQVPYFDENGVLQIQRRSKFSDTDIVFYDKDIESIDYLDATQLINLKSVSFRKSVRYSDKLGSSDDIEIGQKHRKVTLPMSIEQFKEYADFTDEPLITTWSAAGKVINQELAWYSYPRYLLTLDCLARPELQYFDRISIYSDKRKIYGRFTIIGINESYMPGNYTNRFTLLSSQERF